MNMKEGDLLEFKRIKTNLVNWMKKIACDTDLVNKENSPHCPNFGTRCCLTCNRCWAEKNKNNNNNKSTQQNNANAAADDTIIS